MSFDKNIIGQKDVGRNFMAEVTSDKVTSDEKSSQAFHSYGSFEICTSFCMEKKGVSACL